MENNEELQMAWELVEKTGANVFLTGKAGTGKTTFLRELRRLRTRALTDAQLTALKKQTLGQIAVAADSNESMALELGKSFLHYDRFEPLECLFRRIESLTPPQLLEVANEIFDEARLSRLTFR